jgi:hypothetical protein
MRLLWWSVLLNTPAGVSYQAQDIAEWNSNPDAKKSAQPWREALSLPGANTLAPLAGAFAGKEFWRLEPATPLRNSTATLTPEIIAASTEAQELMMVYAPAERTVHLPLGSASSSLKATWHNLQTGETIPAAAAKLATTTQRFTTPAAGDWLLTLQKVSGRTVVAEAKKPALKIDKRGRD